MLPSTPNLSAMERIRSGRKVPVKTKLMWYLLSNTRTCLLYRYMQPKKRIWVEPTFLELMILPFQRLHPFQEEVELPHSKYAQAAFFQFWIHRKLKTFGLNIKLEASTKIPPSEIDCDIKPPSGYMRNKTRKYIWQRTSQYSVYGFTTCAYHIDTLAFFCIFDAGGERRTLFHLFSPKSVRNSLTIRTKIFDAASYWRVRCRGNIR